MNKRERQRKRDDARIVGLAIILIWCGFVWWVIAKLIDSGVMG